MRNRRELPLLGLTMLVICVAAGCGGGGASKTATPTLSAEEASTATVVAAATSTAEADAEARATALAQYAGVTIEKAEIIAPSTPDRASSMPTFVVHLSINNDTSDSVPYVAELMIKLGDGKDVTYGTYRCSNPAPFTSPPGSSDATVTVCASERATPLSPADALVLGQGAALLQARLIFMGDLTGPWFTPSGALTRAG